MKILSMLVMVLFFSLISRADELDNIVTQTQSVDAGTRISGFAALQSYLTQVPLDPRAVQAVTTLLLLESSQLDAADDDADYYFDLINTVADVNDPTAIPALVRIIGTGNRVPQSLAQFGAAALDAVIARAADSDWVVRKCVMITLYNMLSPGNVALVSDQQSMTKIISTLSNGVLDQSPYVSESALGGLQLLSPSHIPEDVNGDGAVDCVDLKLVKASFGKSRGQVGYDPRADVNGDGVVNVLDLSAVARQLPAGIACQ